MVHFHGHDGTAVAKIVDHQLRQQVFESGKNVVLLVPQGPVNAADSSGGKLELADGFRQFVAEVVAVLRSPAARAAVSPAVLGKRITAGGIALSAHSGGYRVVATILDRGGIGVREVFLFDALYGEVPKFRHWLRQATGKRLLSWFNKGAPRQLNEILMERLLEDGLALQVERVEGQLSARALATGPAVFVRTDVPHSQIPWRHNNLRDALATSAFRWAKGASRPNLGKGRGPRALTLR